MVSIRISGISENDGSGLFIGTAMWEGISMERKLRKITQAEYSGRAHQVAKTYTETRNGMVHQYSLHIFHCDGCNQYYEFRSDMIPRPYMEYGGKRYCPDCWETAQHELKEACPDCGTALSVYQRRSFFRGKCRDCWLKEIRRLRECYKPYQQELAAYLEKKGISLEKPFLDGLSETGRPLEQIAEQKDGLLPLRQGEYALYLFSARDGVFAFPDNGIGLRYIKPSPDREFMNTLESIESNHQLLAAASDGRNVYVLDQYGTMYTTEKKSPLAKKPVGEKIIDPLAHSLKIAKEYFTEEQIQTIAKKVCGSGIFEIDSHTYYDPEAQKFFRVLTDGNSYHGYEVSYEQLTKEEVMDRLTRFHFSLFNVKEFCQSGHLPNLVLAYYLPWSEGPYTPPDNFGYGTEFI